MVIIVDCFKLVKGLGKSIGIYNLSLNLIRNLIATKEENDDTQIIVFGNEYNKCDFDIPGVRFVAVPYEAKNKVVCIIWELILVSKYYRKYGGDRIVFPRGFAPLSKNMNDCIIIHDMIPFYYHRNYPKYFNKLENFYIMNRLVKSAQKCKKVITISEASKKEIMKEAKVKSDKIKVIYNGCNRIADIDISSEPHCEDEYIVAITSGLPHKNATGILKAYEEYAKRSEKPLRLKIIGIEDCKEYPLDSGIRKQIDFYRFIKEDKDLHLLIKNAKVFLFLSLVEGFGFPPIEAMQLGVPVICSTYSSLPEVVGDAAVLVDPLNPVEVAEAIMDIEKNPEKVGELIKKGSENILRFNWDVMAKEYWRVIKEL